MMRTLPHLSTLLVLAVLAWAGNAPALAAYTDNPDGTVTDNATGLIWDKCSLGQSNADCSGGSVNAYTWPQALTSAVSANTANYKGHNDWRLPNLKELESIVKMDTANPAIDGAFFPNTASDWYWTSGAYVSDPTLAWIVHFANGSTYAGNNSFHVRLVRGGQSPVSFDALAAVPTPAPASSTPIPTLSEWAVLLLSGLLGLMGWRGLRRRHFRP